jgi:GumC protein
MHSDHRRGTDHRWTDDMPADSSLAEYWHAVYGRRWLVLIVMAAVMLAALVVSLLITPEYRATTTLQIEREALKVVNLENVVPSETPMDRDFYQTQYELLTSRSLARKVIRRAQLSLHPLYADAVATASAKFDAHAEGARGTQRQAAIELALVDPVLAALQIEPVRNSRLVRIHFNSPDPRLAARVANAYAQEFIAGNLERRLEASSFARKYLSDRLAQTRQRLEDAEKRFVDFAEQERIVSVGEDKPSLPAQNLAELNALLATAQNARIKAEAAWREAERGSGTALPQVLSSPLVQSLMQTRAQLSADYQQKLATYKPDYPEMQRLSSQIAESGRQITAEVARIRASIESEYDTASRQERMLEQRIDRLKDEELDLQDRSIRYDMLKREAETSRQLYDGLLQRFKEIGVIGNVGANNISVIDPADVPTRRHSPRIAISITLAGLFGLFAGLTLALLLHLSRPRG